MNVTCQNCKTKLNIPDHKIPVDRESTFLCPKCKDRVRVPAVKKGSSSIGDRQPSFHLPFDEQLNSLVCMGGEALKKKVTASVLQMGMKVESAPDTKAALKKLDYHIYHLVIIDDTFDQNKGFSGIIDRMNTMDMSLRRRICLVWLCNTFNSSDNMASLHASVNTIIHLDDADRLETLLSRALMAHKNLYTVYRDSLKLAGKA